MNNVCVSPSIQINMYTLKYYYFLLLFWSFIKFIQQKQAAENSLPSLLPQIASTMLFQQVFL